eukprot:g3740.t1
MIRALEYQLPHNALVALMIMLHRDVLQDASPLAPWMDILPRFVRRVTFSRAEEQTLERLWHNKLELRDMSASLASYLELSYQVIEAELCGKRPDIFDCREETGGAFSPAAFSHAYSLVSSRCFTVKVSRLNIEALSQGRVAAADLTRRHAMDRQETCVMVPYADLFNHNARRVRPDEDEAEDEDENEDGGRDRRRQPGVHYGLHAAAAAFDVAADRPYAAGEEVKLFYGADTNAETLFSYGFVERDNPNELVALSVPALLPLDHEDEAGGAGGTGWRQALWRLVVRSHQEAAGTRQSTHRDDPGHDRHDRHDRHRGDGDLTEVYFGLDGLDDASRVLPLLRLRALKAAERIVGDDGQWRPRAL